jgi:alpha-amylase
MKRILTIFISILSTLTMSAQGWPENYDGVMLQGFYWDSYTDTKWTTLESQADELSQFFNLIWVPNSAYANATSSNMGYHPVYWFDHKSAFGTEAQLRSMINTFKEKGVGIIEDVVINHRASVNSNWLNFPAETYKGKTYQLTAADICQDDESKNSGYKPTGAKDTGDAWAGARDLDHSGENVQENVMAYEDFLLNDLGYIGFRYDFVKGFAAKYVGLYNKTAQPQFSVGECWDGNKTVVTNWINGTKVDGVIQSAAFDFPLKYYINDAFALNKWSRLNGGCLANDNNYKRYAVTFVDNHDSGRFGDAPLYDNIEAANAFILTMPGTPCVWLGHWKQYPATIKKLITIRKAAGIHNQSGILQKSASSTGYVLQVQGTQGNVLLLLGNATASTDGMKLATEGTNYKVYVSEAVDVSALDDIGDDPVFTIPSFCKVNDGEICAFFEIPSTYSNIRCWAWNDKCNFTTGVWPGATCTLLGNNKGNKVYKWTWNGKAYKPNTTTEMTPDDIPAKIIFNNKVASNNDGRQTADLTFVNGGYYIEQGTLRGVVVTGTQSISRVNTSDNPSAIYSLDGRRVSQPKPGIYIRNNKKVVIR